MPNILGTIQLTKKPGNSQITTSQNLNLPTFDSRLYPSYSDLSYCRIRELRKDPTIKLAKWAVLSPMIHTPWVYVTRKGKGSTEMTDFLEEVFEPLRDTLLQHAVFGALDYGWQPFEVCYKPEDGRIVIDEFKQLLQDYTTILVYIGSGMFAGFANETYELDGSEIVTEDYAFNVTFEVEGTDWYGNSVYKDLQSIITSWDRVQATANRFDAKMAGSTWVVYYPVGETSYNGTVTSNDEIARSILSSLEASGGVAIPDEIQEWMDDSIDKEARGKWRIEMISANTSTSMSFVDRQKYLDALKMRAFALPERSILEGSHGTKAEADVHGDIALSIVDSRHRLLCSQLNTMVVSKLLRLNFGEKYQWDAYIRPAPLVDNQFATIKELYRLILQTPETLMQEIGNMDLRAMREELGVPTNG